MSLTLNDSRHALPVTNDMTPLSLERVSLSLSRADGGEVGTPAAASVVEIGSVRRITRAEADETIVTALTAALLASFRRQPIVTDDSPTGTNRHHSEAA